MNTKYYNLIFKIEEEHSNSDNHLKDVVLKGIDLSNLDESTAPGKDFYQYANGGWKNTHPLTAEYSRFGTFDLLRENSRLQLKELITNLSDSPEAKVKDTIAQKVSDLYAMGMDAERLNRESASPILPFINKIQNADIKDLFSLLAWIHTGLGGAFFGAGVGPDPNDSNRNILHIGEAGLSLGDRDYYLEKSETNDNILVAFEKYVKRIMMLSGYDEESAQRVWDTVIKLETDFAKHKMTREDRRDPTKRFNMRSMEQIYKDYPNLNWETYFRNLGLLDVKEANVLSLDFMDFLNSYLPSLSEQEIKDYLTYDVISGSTGLMSDDFHDASFELFGKVMSGQEEPQPRWKRAMSLPNSMLGEAVGQLYVEKYFPEKNKEYMLRLVENLRDALGKHIKELSWMSDETKAKALDKLANLTVKIGYPDKWKDYSEIKVDPEKSYLENVYNASVWFTKDNLSKIKKPVDKTEWHFTPQTVNAYYSPVSNEICFPAGILQPPYFDPDADDAINYGAIGVVIGHEMTHGFDDQGRKFDKNGNLSEWWSEEDAKSFNNLADKLVDQFNKVEVAPGVNANGRFTLGENIADQGGLRVALTAYLDTLPDKMGEIIDGFSPLQRFYISYANVWADNIRAEEILSRTKTDPHSLGVNRVNVTLRNLEPFFEAFNIKEGDDMYRDTKERVIIW